MIAMSVANAAHFYSLCSIFSYAGFLAVDAGWARDEDAAGFAAGLLPTSVMVGRLVTSISWGHVADRCGRRPAMLVSMASVALGNLCFGFSTNLVAALGVRFLLLGAGNGWTALMGMCTLEIAGEDFQAQAFSYIISVGSVIATLGPALGGWTYGALGSRFPALPPSLIGSGLGIVAFCVNYMWLPETRPHRATASNGLATPADSNASTTSDSITSGEGDGKGREAVPLRRVLCSHPFPLMMALRAAHGMFLFGGFEIVPLWVRCPNPRSLDPNPKPYPYP